MSYLNVISLTGCGVNLLNSDPTTCISDLIAKNNGTKKPTFEKYFALTFNELEKLYNQVQENGIQQLLDLYYKFWLHG